MANNESVDGNGGSYTQKHPRRVGVGYMLMGAALGASLMAARKSRDKNVIEKFIDQISH
jgi:hypothetical protein